MWSATHLTFTVKEVAAAKAEKAAILMKLKAGDPVASIINPTSGGAKAMPMFKHMATTPKPVPADEGPRISDGNAITIGGTIAAVIPKATIEAISAISVV